MRYGSVCSGIEAASVAWEAPLGWEPAWFSEVDAFPSAVLDHHWPFVPNKGDMTQILESLSDDERNIDLLVGGTPCQSFSVAGLQKGLDDERGNLALEYVRLLRGLTPRWFVWENVPGVFSSSGGRDFACILSAFTGRDIQPQKFGKAGIIRGSFYSVAWRVLDAQYFGVAQRRRRVFVVGHLGDDWRPPAAVLFERDCLSGDTPPRREKGQDVAGTLASRTTGGGFPGTDEAISGYVQPWPADTASTLDAAFGAKQGLEDQHVNGGCPLFVPQAIHGTQDPDTLEEVAHTLGRNHGQENAVVLPIHDKATRFKGGGATRNSDGAGNGLGVGSPGDPRYTLTAGDKHGVLCVQGTVVGRSEHNGPQGGGVNVDICYTLNAADRHVVAFAENTRGELRLEGGDGTRTGALTTGGGKPGQGTPAIVVSGVDGYNGALTGDVACTLGASGSSSTAAGPTLYADTIVRRLTPLECERLQGFPDHYTQIPYKNKPAAKCPDGPRYKALGNSMAVPVMMWIGTRIDFIDKFLTEN